MDLFLWITQACNTLTSTVAPSVDAMGVHICIALATIMLVWLACKRLWHPRREDRASA